MRMAVIVISFAVAVAVVPEHEEVEQVHSHTHQSQQEHHCSRMFQLHFREQGLGKGAERCRRDVCSHFPFTATGCTIRSTASQSRMPVTSHVLRTDTSAPSTSTRWYL